MLDRTWGQCLGNCIQTGPKTPMRLLEQKASLQNMYSPEMHIARIVDYAVLRICPKCPSFVSEILNLTHSCTAVVWHMQQDCVTVSEPLHHLKVSCGCLRAAVWRLTAAARYHKAAV